MSSSVWGFIGVLVGGLFTFAGTAWAEQRKAGAAREDRREKRDQLAREFQRETLVRLQEAMGTYRDALVAYEQEDRPSAHEDRAVSRARVGFQMLVHRVSAAPTRTAVLAWEAEALAWFQEDDGGTAAREAGAWDAAMRSTGAAISGTD